MKTRSKNTTKPCGRSGTRTMTKDPAFLFYYQDFLVGCDHMNLEQVGGYIKCLCHQANRYTIRKSHMESLVASHMGDHMASQENLKVVLEKFVLDENGEYYNQRLRDEMEKRRRYTASRLENLRPAHMAPHMAPHMENENDTSSFKKGGVGENKRRVPKVFVPPTLEDVTSYRDERKSSVDPIRFFDSNTARGWVDKNRVPYKDWKAVFRTWENWDKDKTIKNSTSSKLPAPYVED